MPISVNKALGAKDHYSPGGAVISAFLSAVIEGDTIVGWLGNSAFSVQEVLPNGTLAPLDLTNPAAFSTKIIPPIKKVWNCSRRWPTGASVDLDEASRRLSAGLDIV